MNGAVWQGLGMGCVLQSQNGTNIRWMIKGQTVWPHSNRNTVVQCSRQNFEIGGCMGVESKALFLN